MALTDDELIKIANEVINSEEDLHDVWYYQQQHCLFDGNDPVYSNHLFFHYKNWSINPISFDIFIDTLTLINKNKKNLFIDKNTCNINLEKLIGEYVEKQRKTQKEKRLRKISGSKS